MKVNALILVLIGLLLTSFCCKEEPVSPIDNLTPGRRDYTWRVDTIDSPNNRFSCIWGSTSNDVWVGGKGGITSYDRLWHFDGNQWKTYNQYVSVFPNCIFGLTHNDVWIGGNDGKIFHFNGSLWSENYRYWNDSVYTTDITYISGISNDNIYAVGTLYYQIGNTPYGFILHYNGENWKLIHLTYESVQFLKLAVIDGSVVYVTGYILPRDSIPESISFYKLQNGKTTKIFQKPLSEITWASLNEIGGLPYFLIGKELNRFTNNEFQMIMTFDINNFGYQIYGRNIKDIFLRMSDGLSHYNGTNIEYLYQFENYNTSVSSNALLLDSTVFFIAEDNTTGKHIILEGSIVNN